MTSPAARLLLVCGPSGSGKSHLAARSGLPVLRLDDFYKAGDDPTLPRDAEGSVDWDAEGAWRFDVALAAVERLCAHGCADVPVYDISRDRIVGTRLLDLAGAPVFLAEGLFAGRLISPCRARGLLADALCLRRSPLATFVRRLARDLRERRKPPLLLVRRGWRLLREDARLVSGLLDDGARPVGMSEARRTVRRLAAGPPR